MNDDKDLLNRLHSKLIEILIYKIQSGEASAGDLGVARQFLKDNGVDISAKDSEPLMRLNRVLPFNQQDSDDEED